MKAKEFWNELVTRKSWETLTALSKEYDFIVIGGWAVYLWTGIHKSKDIDIVVDYDMLNLLKHRYNLEKNERLKKYEIKMGEFDIDIYLPGYSKLAFPLEALGGYVENIQGIRVPIPEILVILKQGGEIARRGSIKGKKDVIDILTILIYTDFSLERYREIIKKFSLSYLEEELKKEIELFNPKDCEYLGQDFNEFAKWKKRFLEKMR